VKFLNVACSIFLVLIGFSFTLGAKETQQSDWLNTVEGSRDFLLGGEVLSVFHNNNITFVEVGFSEDKLKYFHSAFVESRMPQKIIAYATEKDLLKDKLNRPYGIRFQLTQPPGFEFRVKLNEKVERP
jgi:hypothetical protein